ncbi:hypothetical protein HYW83_01555 [Candidatus Peregrinibacteria bacterium]|nr:hypothetical protein [Candidatus Peregrinibacteria bacterium]
MSACSSKATVTHSKPVEQTPEATTDKNPPDRPANDSVQTNGQQDERVGQTDSAAGTNRVAERDRSAETDNSAGADNWQQDNRGMADDLGLPVNDTPQNDSASKDAGSPAQTNEEEIEEEVINIPDAGQYDAGSSLPADPHVFATEELGVLVRTQGNTEVKPAEKPFWADDALATSTFERESGKQYSVLVYEKRPDELFEDWLMRSKVGGTTVSQRRVRTANGHRAYVYATDDYGAVPNVHIIVPTQRFVYYFKSEEETFEVPDDFVNFIREIEVQ